MAYSSWDGKKVDVSFHSAFWPFLAHNNIHVIFFYLLLPPVIFSYHLTLDILLVIGQVKNEWVHNAGAGVVAHVADSLKQQESSAIIAASL